MGRYYVVKKVVLAEDYSPYKQFNYAFLNEWFNYNKKEGILTWKKKAANRNIIGKEAGYQKHGQDYKVVILKGEYYMVHRICWVLGKKRRPIGAIKHRNGIRTDNRMKNLKDVAFETYLERKKRRTKRSDNRFRITKKW